jgi:hypothetical protein
MPRRGGTPANFMARECHIRCCPSTVSRTIYDVERSHAVRHTVTRKHGTVHPYRPPTCLFQCSSSDRGDVSRLDLDRNVHNQTQPGKRRRRRRNAKGL